MTESIQQPQHPCREEFNCFYKVDGVYTFGQQAEAMLSTLREKRHKGSLRFVNISTPFPLPCEFLDEKDRQCGIGDLFAGLGTMR